MFSIGAWVGTVVTFAGSGVLCESGFDNGWGSIFYITGISVMYYSLY
jgi:ACS family sodium-dependent inorganic phosphate cotransporter-like MFS transporter 5